MYEISVERSFPAAHAITMEGRCEPTHDHQWRVCVVVAGDRLDEDGLLCDFHVVEQVLERVVEPLRARDLNRTSPFDRINPTAENVARHIAESVAPELPDGVALSRVSVTEAPGCVATYRPSRA